jgi:hypothetical protein
MFYSHLLTFVFMTTVDQDECPVLGSIYPFPLSVYDGCVLYKNDGHSSKLLGDIRIYSIFALEAQQNR